MKKKSVLIFVSLSLLTIGCNLIGGTDEIANQEIEGFSIPLPNNWVDRSQLDIKDNLAKFDFNEAEIKEFLKTNNGSVPVALYMKYNPEEYNGPIPTIQVNLRPNTNKTFNGFKEATQLSIDEMNDIFKNFKIVVPIEEVEVNGIKGIRFVSQFDLGGKKGENWTIRSWTYGFPSGNYFYQINFSDTEDEDSSLLYEVLLDHIKFTK